jgi:predicted nuclease with TOPRIM domain
MLEETLAGRTQTIKQQERDIKRNIKEKTQLSEEKAKLATQVEDLMSQRNSQNERLVKVEERANRLKEFQKRAVIEQHELYNTFKSHHQRIADEVKSREHTHLSSIEKMKKDLDIAQSRVDQKVRSVKDESSRLVATCKCRWAHPLLQVRS